MEGKFKVSCFGAGFVGLPTTSVLALKNPDLDVPEFKFSLSSLISMRREFRQSYKERCQSMSLV